jgi:hypothetical protein
MGHPKYNRAMEVPHNILQGHMMATVIGVQFKLASLFTTMCSLREFIRLDLQIQVGTVILQWNHTNKVINLMPLTNPLDHQVMSHQVVRQLIPTTLAEF